MRAVVSEAFGRPPAVTAVADPSPAAHGAVVRVEATGLCRSDWHGWIARHAAHAYPELLALRLPVGDLVTREIGLEAAPEALMGMRGPGITVIRPPGRR